MSVSCSLLPVPVRPVLRESGAPQGKEAQPVPRVLRARRAKPGRRERRDLKAPLDLEAHREPPVRKV